MSMLKDRILVTIKRQRGHTHALSPAGINHHHIEKMVRDAAAIHAEQPMLEQLRQQGFILFDEHMTIDVQA